MGLPCHKCVHVRSVPGNCHIQCSKPASGIVQRADMHGVRNGWFYYPILFDPGWGPADCPNFEQDFLDFEENTR